jgi:hypothetical protein
VGGPAGHEQGGGTSYSQVVTEVEPPAGRWTGAFGWVFTVVCALVGIVSFAALPGEYADNTAMRDAPVCAEPVSGPSSSPDCLVEVPGRITDQRSGSGRYSSGVRWQFSPGAAAPAGFEPGWVRFRDDRDPEDWSPAMTRLLAGEPVTALYWGEDPVAFVTPDGTVEATGFAEDAWTALLWVGIGALALAAMRPVSSRLGRRGAREHGETGMAGLGRVVLGLTPVLVVLGALAAVFPDRLSGQLLAFGCTLGIGALLSAALVAAGRVRVRRSVGGRP